jgi:hypothetical protein
MRPFSCYSAQPLVVTLLLSLLCSAGVSAQAQGIRREDPAPPGCVTGPSLVYDTAAGTPDSLRPDMPPKVRPPLVAPQYPTAQHPEGSDGFALYELVVDSTGAVLPCSVQALEGTDAAFIAAGRPAVLRARYAPARKAGLPVAARIRQRVAWRVRP